MSAENFLRQTMTVVDSPKAINEKNRKFLERYATVVGSPAVIDEWCGPGPVPPIPPTPIEATWYLVKDEESWTAAKADGALARYYEDHPEEDLWNGERKNGFNDAMYAVTLYSDATGETEVKTAEFEPEWGDPSQKLTDTDTGDVYYTAIFYSVTEDIYELFTDAACTESAGLFMRVTEKTFPGFFNAYPAVDLAVQPWAVVSMEEGFKGKIKFEYAGEEYYPFGIEDRVFAHGYGIVDLHQLLGIPSLAEENPSTFEKENLIITLLPKAE